MADPRIPPGYRKAEPGDVIINGEPVDVCELYDQVGAMSHALVSMTNKCARLEAEIERLRTGLENIAVMNETNDCERLRNTARAVLNGWETTKPSEGGGWMNEHEIRRAQAVTRWVEGVKARARWRTRDGSLINNRTDAEYVVEHIKQQAAEVERLQKVIRDAATDIGDCHAKNSTDYVYRKLQAEIDRWITHNPAERAAKEAT